MLGSTVDVQNPAGSQVPYSMVPQFLGLDCYCYARFCPSAVRRFMLYSSGNSGREPSQRGDSHKMPDL